MISILRKRKISLLNMETSKFLNNVELEKAQENLPASKEFWSILEDKGASDPVIGVGRDGGIHFSWRWSDGDKYIECEFMEEEKIETFYENTTRSDKSFEEAIESGNIDSEDFSNPEDAANWIYEFLKSN